jgi:uncharacterized surface protein with fasciclin (FAS1) repeats
MLLTFYIQQKFYVLSWNITENNKGGRIMKCFGIILIAILLALVVTCNAAEPAMKEAASNASQKNIVETAIAAGDFSTLVEAIKVAGLVETLSSPGPFTVFAPTDGAFAKIPKADLGAILANKSKLTAILTYHVVPGKVMSTDLKDAMKANTVEGAALTFKVGPKGVMVNNANVTKADILASNGVIHVIDTVLLPPAKAETMTSGSAAEKAKVEVEQKTEAAKTEVAQKAEAAKTEVAQKAEAVKTEVEKKAEEAKPAQQSMPGFEGVLAISGLIAVAYIFLQRRN